jgi:hypothetical protein
MPTVRINARDLIFQVQDLTTTWRTVSGITKASINYAENEETVDTTDYDSIGNSESEIMQRGASMKIEGNKKYDSVTGVYNTGQATLDTYTGSTYVGPTSQVPIRFRYPAETQWRNWTATISRGEEGGGNNDKVGFSYTITRSGAQTLTAAP